MHDCLRRNLSLGRGAAAALLVSSCRSYPDSSERYDDNIVYTAHASDVSFNSFQTFSVDPEVHLATLEEDDTVETGSVDKALGDMVIASVVSNMQQLGYSQVDAGDNPDLGLTVTAINGLVSGSVTGGYWWGYYGAYWGFPGWGYYYPYSVDYSYRPGTLIVDMVDLNSARKIYPSEPDMSDPGAPNARPGGLPVVWTMVGYQAYTDQSSSVRAADATSAIQQGFAQSSYLGSQ
jgi:hypothetical protein